MKKLIPSLVLLLTAMPAEFASGTVIRPTYVPGLSRADSAGASTPERMVDNSGMIPAIWTGTSRADTLAAKHVFNPLTDASWLTNDPPPAGGQYFGGAAADPVLVFDLGRNRLITELFFWQLQRNMPTDSWAKDITVEFAADPGGGSPPDFSLITGFSRTLAPAPMPPPVPWTNDVQNFSVPGSKVARFIKLTVTDNRGGPRVGLGEFRVKVGDEPLVVGDEPLVELPALTVINANQGPTNYRVTIHNLGPLPFVINTLTFNPGAGRFHPLFTLPLSIAPGTTDLMIHDTTGGLDFVWSVATLKIGSGTELEKCSLAMSGPPSSDVPICYSEDRTIGPYPKGVGAQLFEFDVTNKANLFKASEILNIWGVSAGGPFVTISSEASFPTQVSSNTTVTFNAKFDPKDDPGLVLTDSIVIASDDPDGNTTVSVVATILSDLEISTPPIVTIPWMAAGVSSSFDINLSNWNDAADYSFDAAPSISGGDGSFTVTGPPGEIQSSDAIKVEFTHTGIDKVYYLTIGLSLADTTGHLSEFKINFMVKVGHPVELVTEGFQTERLFKCSVSKVLGDTFHFQGSSNLKDWATLDSGVITNPNVTADGDFYLNFDRGTVPAMFIRLRLGAAPP